MFRIFLILAITVCATQASSDLQVNIGYGFGMSPYNLAGGNYSRNITSHFPNEIVNERVSNFTMENTSLTQGLLPSFEYTYNFYDYIGINAQIGYSSVEISATQIDYYSSVDSGYPGYDTFVNYDNRKISMSSSHIPIKIGMVLSMPRGAVRPYASFSFLYSIITKNEVNETEEYFFDYSGNPAPSDTTRVEYKYKYTSSNGMGISGKLGVKIPLSDMAGLDIFVWGDLANAKITKAKESYYRADTLVSTTDITYHEDNYNVSYTNDYNAKTNEEHTSYPSRISLSAFGFALGAYFRF